MPVFWVTFRFADRLFEGRSGEQRQEAFKAVLSDLTRRVWAEPAAFVVFEASASITVVAALLQETIDPTCDLFLLNEIDGEDAILCGKYEDPDILSFMPHLKTLI